jgi:hypothetical protein
MTNDQKNLLIITSTVFVNSNLTVLTDPEIRKKQYIDSILFYLNTEMIDSLIICDNSDFDYSTIPSIQSLALEKGKDVEFLYFKGASELIFKLGKGYGEGEIMSHVFENSQLLQQFTHFFKVTGRVKVDNVDAILRQVKPASNHFQQIRLNPFLKVKLRDSRFYRCSKEVFSTYLINAHQLVNDSGGYYLEHAYTNALKDNGVPFRNFPVLPRFQGISGSHGGSLAQGNFAYKVKALINVVQEKYHSFTSKK